MSLTSVGGGSKLDADGVPDMVTTQDAKECECNDNRDRLLGEKFKQQPENGLEVD